MSTSLTAVFARPRLLGQHELGEHAVVFRVIVLGIDFTVEIGEQVSIERVDVLALLWCHFCDQFVRGLPAE